MLLTDIKHAFGANPFAPVYEPAPTRAAASAPALEWLDLPTGIRSIGHDGNGFAFDNEGPSHQVLIGHGRIANRPVSIGEYLEFMADGGYATAGLWLSEGWATIQAKGWQAPDYWELHDGRWQVRTLHGSWTRTRPNRSSTSAITRRRPSRSGPASACRPSSNGKWRPVAMAAPPAGSTGSVRTPARWWRASTRTSGNGPAAPTCPIRVSARPPARSGNTTASS